MLPPDCKRFYSLPALPLLPKFVHVHLELTEFVKETKDGKRKITRPPE